MTFIALLCGINVGGNRKVPMADLRALATDLGFEDPKTYIQSGNLVFGAKGTARAVETKLEKGLGERFGFPVEALVRTARAWSEHAAGNPFAEASATEPNRVMLLVSRATPKGDAVTALQGRATAGERVASGGGAVWIHYPAGAGATKLSPSLVDRLVGSKVTARNWRTVQELLAMASG